MNENPIQNTEKEDNFVSSMDFKESLATYNEALAETGPVQKSIGSIGRTFESHETNMSVRSEYSRGDYEYFKAGESVPKLHKDIMDICDTAYENIAIIKNVIDLMAEFGISGIRFQHPDKSIEKFYNTWFQKIDGIETSEKFLNILYRLGNVVVNRLYGKIPTATKKKWRQGKASDVKYEETPIRTDIPLEYYFNYPGNVKVLNEKEALTTGKYLFGLQIASSLYKDDSGVSAYFNRYSDRVHRLHPKVGKLAKNSSTSRSYTIPLSPDRTTVYYYKKDDWRLWAKPMTYSIIKDLIMYEKLKLADLSALDGVISNVRLWRMGIYNDSNPAHSILPTRTGIAKLRSILHNNVGGGVLDLVWGPELDFKESATDAHKWLGIAKYEPTLNAIYDGLGIPAVLRTGSAKTSSGEIIGLQTLIERLEYGRSVLVQFWTEEVKRVHKAMGYTSVLPKIMFDQMILADRAAERKLLMDLADRDIISNESIVEIFGRSPEVESSRVRNQKSREGSMTPNKASPFHNPDKEHEYKKLFIQGGDVTPSEVGIELGDRKDGEAPRLDKQKEAQIEIAKNRPGPAPSTNKTGQSGRPKNITETKKRKPKPDTKAQLLFWAIKAQNEVEDIITDGVLRAFGKTSARCLTKAQMEQFLRIKSNVFFMLEPHQEINATVLHSIISNNPKPEEDILRIKSEMIEDFISINNRGPYVDELKYINASAYTLYYGSEYDGDD